MRHQDDVTVEPANDPVTALVHLNSASLDFWNVRSLRLPRAQSSNHTNDLENQFCVFSPWNSRWPRHRTPPTVDSNWAVFPRMPMCSFEPHGRPVCSASARPSPETNNVAWPKSFSHSLSLLFGPWVRPPSLTSGPVGMHDLICAIVQRSTYFKGNNRASVYHLDCTRALHRYVSAV